MTNQDETAIEQESKRWRRPSSNHGSPIQVPSMQSGEAHKIDATCPASQPASLAAGHDGLARLLEMMDRGTVVDQANGFCPSR